VYATKPSTQKKEKQMAKHMQEVEWITRLPNAGGDWGRGIVGTVRSLEAGVADNEAKKAELQRQIDALSEDSKTKKKLLKATVKRAGEEAPMMFGNAQIASARGPSADA
jgi:hypothetical protein